MREKTLHRWARVLVAAAYAGLAVLALVIAMTVTPPASITVFGQNLKVGAVPPSLTDGLSGPGQADLFGEGPVDTVQRFDGPIRPLIVWQSFNRDNAASQFIETAADKGRTLRTEQLGQALAQGWISYFVRLVVIAGLVGGALYLVVTGALGLVHGTDRRLHRRRHHALMLVISGGLAVVVTAGSAALTVASARSQLAGVATLADLTGTARLAPAPTAVGPTRTDIDVAVLGDSTAAGVGNTPITKPTPLDETCGRSSDAYAVVLASATGLRVENLACSSATLERGVLGPQFEGNVVIPPQVGVLKSIRSLRTVVLSVGANDIGWSDFLQYCYGLQRCDDQASQRLLENRLDTFRLQYAQLLQQLATLPSQPTVIVTGYYDPLGDTFNCTDLIDPQAPAAPPIGYGFAADPGADNQAQKVAQKVEPLRSMLTQLNVVLEQGADAFGFGFVLPRFDGHALCSEQSWVQGLSARYPFHPNAAGELAIASVQLPHLTSMLAG